MKKRYKDRLQINWKLEPKQQKQKLQETIPNNNPARKGLVQAPVVVALCARLGVSGGKEGAGPCEVMELPGMNCRMYPSSRPVPIR